MAQRMRSASSVANGDVKCIRVVDVDVLCGTVHRGLMAGAGEGSSTTESDRERETVSALTGEESERSVRSAIGRESGGWCAV